MEKQILKFWSTGCGNCRAMTPIVDAVAGTRTDIEFRAVNTEEAEDLVEKYNISTLPTLIFLRNGEEVGKLTGLRPRSLIEKKIAEVF